MKRLDLLLGVMLTIFSVQTLKSQTMTVIGGNTSKTPRTKFVSESTDGLYNFKNFENRDFTGRTVLSETMAFANPSNGRLIFAAFHLP